MTTMLGCKVKVDGIKLLLENSSDVHNPITVLIYLDNMLQDTVVVYRNNKVVKYEEVLLKYPKGVKAVDLKFKIVSIDNETSCKVWQDSLNDKSIIHVNFIETLFKKGDYYKGRNLKKDSVIRSELYCEALYHKIRR